MEAELEGMLVGSWVQGDRAKFMLRVRYVPCWMYGDIQLTHIQLMLIGMVVGHGVIFTRCNINPSHLQAHTFYCSSLYSQAGGAKGQVLSL